MFPTPEDLKLNPILLLLEHTTRRGDALRVIGKGRRPRQGWHSPCITANLCHRFPPRSPFTAFHGENFTAFTTFTAVEPFPPHWGST